MDDEATSPPLELGSCPIEGSGLNVYIAFHSQPDRGPVDLVLESESGRECIVNFGEPFDPTAPEFRFVIPFFDDIALRIVIRERLADTSQFPRPVGDIHYRSRLYTYGDEAQSTIILGSDPADERFLLESETPYQFGAAVNRLINLSDTPVDVYSWAVDDVDLPPVLEVDDLPVGGLTQVFTNELIPALDDPAFPSRWPQYRGARYYTTRGDEHPVITAGGSDAEAMAVQYNLSHFCNANEIPDVERPVAMTSISWVTGSNTIFVAGSCISG